MSDARKDHRLVGLEPDNLLAFLALLGLLRSLEISHPELRPRAYWDLSVSPLRPVLTMARPATIQDVCTSALDGVVIFRNSLRAFYRLKTGLPASRNLFRSLARRCAKAITTSDIGTEKYRLWRLRCDLMACLATEVYTGRSEVEQSPLKLPSGQMAFVAAMFDLANQCRAEDVERSFFGSWSYSFKGSSLRLSPEEAQRYAYRASDPSPEGASTELGASALAGMGVLSLPMSPGHDHWTMVAYSGTRREGRIVWPIWGPNDDMAGRGASLSGIEAMLNATALERMGENRMPPGAQMIAVARRYLLDPSQGDYGNIAGAELRPILAFITSI